MNNVLNEIILRNCNFDEKVNIINSLLIIHLRILFISPNI